MFYFVFVLNVLSRTICCVLNCCAAIRHPSKIEALRICCDGPRPAEQIRSRTAAVPQLVEVQALIIIETDRLRRRIGAETDRRRIWWNLAVREAAFRPRMVSLPL